MSYIKRVIEQYKLSNLKYQETGKSYNYYPEEKADVSDHLRWRSIVAWSTHCSSSQVNQYLIYPLWSSYKQNLSPHQTYSYYGVLNVSSLSKTPRLGYVKYTGYILKIGYRSFSTQFQIIRVLENYESRALDGWTKSAVPFLTDLSRPSQYRNLNCRNKVLFNGWVHSRCCMDPNTHCWTRP